jgi:hypothetical protein
MHSYLKDLAFACIGLGAVFCIPALLTPARRRDREQSGRRDSRHGRSHSGQTPMRLRADGWPDLRTCVTVMAIGASLLADQSTGDRVRLLLSLPVFAVLVWNVLSWLGSRGRRRSGDQQLARDRHERARYADDPRYAAEPRYAPDSRREPDPRRRPDSRSEAGRRRRPDSRPEADPAYSADPRRRAEPRSEADPRQRADPRRQADVRRRTDLQYEPDPRRSSDPRYEADVSRRTDPRHSTDPRAADGRRR